MKVLLVNPPRFNDISVIREERCEITERYSVLPPYSLLQLAAILNQEDHQVELIDANGANIKLEQVAAQIKNAAYDVLVFRFTPTTFAWDNQIASISKQYHSQAVTVGICWTLRTVPQSVMENAADLDVYIMHEYETVVPAVVSAISQGKCMSKVQGIAYRNNGNITVNDAATSLSDWNSLPTPAYDLLPSLKDYFINTHHGSPFTILYAGKGCPFSCIYCTERNTKLKNRSAESILNEIRFLKQKFKVKTISFFDETFTIDRDRAIAVSEKIRDEKLHVSWYCNTRVNLVDKQLLKTMYDGGCRGVSFGIESGSQQILNNAKKGVTVQQAENAIKLAKKAGIKVYCSFIFGLPGENWNTVNETIKFVKHNLPTGAQFNVAVPYPGTELYEIAVNRGWVKKDFSWSNLLQYDAPMRTDELTFEELNLARKKAYHALYFSSQWWLQNIWHVAKEPSDLGLATKYVAKIFKNYGLHKMAHAH